MPPCNRPEGIAVLHAVLPEVPGEGLGDGAEIGLGMAEGDLDPLTDPDAGDVPDPVETGDGPDRCVVTPCDLGEGFPPTDTVDRVGTDGQFALGDPVQYCRQDFSSPRWNTKDVGVARCDLLPQGGIQFTELRGLDRQAFCYIGELHLFCDTDLLKGQRIILFQFGETVFDGILDDLQGGQETGDIT